MSDSELAIARGFVIGYALLPGKQKSFITPSLQETARSHGVDLVPIDLDRPLCDQGPFHAIIHKLTAMPKWHSKLLAFSESHPEVLIIDPPSAIARLSNRLTMLQAVSELEVIASSDFTVSVPKQCLFEDDSDELGQEEQYEKMKLAVAASDLAFPVIVKPFAVDGSARSHTMLLAFNSESLRKVKPPVIIQEFINHGGIIFKVYVAGDDFHYLDIRTSIPDIDASQHINLLEPVPFCQISNTHISGMEHLQKAELPPSDLVSHLASGLRKALGLNLFNFDLIRDSKFGDRYYVIDINYFPGYEKLPDYEITMSKFFASLR